MSSLEFTIPAPLPIRKRLRASMIKPLIFTVIFASMGMGFKAMMHDYPLVQKLLPEIIGLLFIIALWLQYRWAEKEETFFMTHFKMDESLVEISYLYKDEPKTISGSPKDFIFEKKGTMGRTGSTYQQSYLNIYYQQNFVLRQYTSEDWTDRKFMEIVYNSQH